MHEQPFPHSLQRSAHTITGGGAPTRRQASLLPDADFIMCRAVASSSARVSLPIPLRLCFESSTSPSLFSSAKCSASVCPSAAVLSISTAPPSACSSRAARDAASSGEQAVSFSACPSPAPAAGPAPSPLRSKQRTASTAANARSAIGQSALRNAAVQSSSSLPSHSGSECAHQPRPCSACTRASCGMASYCPARTAGENGATPPSVLEEEQPYWQGFRGGGDVEDLPRVLRVRSCEEFKLSVRFLYAIAQGFFPVWSNVSKLTTDPQK
eukprot:445660-Rhodomonas_salina.2